MKTIELMSTGPRSVRAGDRLDAAARAMWEGDCGLVPVVDGEGVVVGVITDRDVCMAAYTQGRCLAEVPVASVMARGIGTCRADEPVAEVMQRMQNLTVHRLPVVDARDHLVGVISTNDLVRAAHARPAAVDPAVVVRTLATIGAPRSAAAPPTLTALSPGWADGHKQAPAKQAPAKQAAAKQAPAKKTPAKKTPAKKTPAKKTAAKKTAAKGRAPGKVAGGSSTSRTAAKSVATGATKPARRARKS